MHASMDERYVAKTLGCSTIRASLLLRQNGGDCDKAIQAWRAMASSLPPPPPRHPTPDKPIATTHPSHEESSGDETNDEVQTPETDDALTEWDFTLPHIPAPRDFINGGRYTATEFPIKALIGAIQNGENCETIRNHLAVYDRDVVRNRINDQVAGFPSMFYVVEKREPGLIRLWVKYGGDVDARATCGLSKGVPLLAFAVASGGSFKTDTTEVVTTLLSLGASSVSLPKAFYFPLTRDLLPEGPADREMPELTQQPGAMSWCTTSARALIASRMNYLQRYYLHMASVLKPAGARAKQVTRYKDAENLLGVPYSLIGQTPAAEFLKKRLLQHLAKPPRVPLVMIFAGPSGHGKTELARKLGELLSLEMEIVDCTNKSDEKEMFGARSPYQGWEKGSPLNNFLARKAGTRCIVFLDEFEKTTQDVRQTLLLPFQNGEYENRTNKSTVDCSKTIWILATNAFDATIHDFCESKQEHLFQSTNQTAIEKTVKDFCKVLRKEAISKFGAPLTGRISEIIPFLTFSHTEQAAVAHKCLTEVGKDLAKPVVISDDEKSQRFVGDIAMQVPKDYSVCRIIAQEEYVEQLGARSVINGVGRLIEGEMVNHYLEMEGEIKEGQSITTYRVAVNVDDGIEVCHIRSSATKTGSAALQDADNVPGELMWDSDTELSDGVL